MIRIISPVDRNGNSTGAVAFTCSNISKSLSEAFSDTKEYVFSSKKFFSRLIRSVFLLIRSFFWIIRGNTLCIIYPTIPFYPATSLIKYYFSSVVYRLLLLLNKKSKGRIILFVIDLPIEQENSFHTNAIKIPQNKLLAFEDMLFCGVSKVVFCSKGFKDIVDQRKLPYCIDCEVCSIGYCKQTIIFPVNKRKKIFYSGELTREYEKNMLLNICHHLSLDEELVVCGRKGEWLNELKMPNVKYMGYVDSLTHDKIASQCNFGLIVYPNRGYYKYVTPAKLNVYISMSLPVLAVENDTIAHVFNGFEAGQCVDGTELIATIREWCDLKKYEIYKKKYEEIDYHKLYLISLRNMLA